MAGPAPQEMQEIQQIPLNMVGGNHFGRYNKISAEQTFNFIVSDGALVPYAGYANVLTQSPNVPGRAIYQSQTANSIFAVWGAGFYQLRQMRTSDNYPVFTAEFQGALLSYTGDVYISENNNSEIAITDLVNLYVYNYSTDTFMISTTSSSPGPNQFTVPFTAPGYISFQNGRLILADTDTNFWYLSALNMATVWSNSAAFVGTLQTKPDTVQAAIPMPSGGNELLVFGHNVVELWQDIGAATFPYQRSSTVNIDYGCLNASSIAGLDNYVVWLAANEQSGATLMVFNGQHADSITTDGMDFKLADLTNPTNCTGFLFRQDGHLVYQFTFPDDNLSYIYDFETKLFFTVTDENLNYHPARNVVFFNNFYYFVSLNGGNLYEFGTQYTHFQYSSTNIKEIPRIRITPPVRLPTQRNFIIKSVGFTIENGQRNTIIPAVPAPINLAAENGVLLTGEDGIQLILNQPGINPDGVKIASEAVDISISRDGAENFGSHWRLNMNPSGVRRSRFLWQRLGQANDATFQFQFWGFGRFVVVDTGLVEMYV